MYLALVSVPDRKNGMTIQATVSGAGTWDENLDGQHQNYLVFRTP
jgi:hypothetical protein